jgi:hypothetical protein
MFNVHTVTFEQTLLQLHVLLLSLVTEKALPHVYETVSCALVSLVGLSCPLNDVSPIFDTCKSNNGILAAHMYLFPNKTRFKWSKCRCQLAHLA